MLGEYRFVLYEAFENPQAPRDIRRINRLFNDNCRASAANVQGHRMLNYIKNRRIPASRSATQGSGDCQQGRNSGQLNFAACSLVA